MNRQKNTQVAVEKALISNVSKSRVRDRIMRTASDLFYCRGIRCVGVDAIASEAGHQQDELLPQLRFEGRTGRGVFARRGASRAGNGGMRRSLALAGDPRAQVEALFNMLVRKIRLQRRRAGLRARQRRS